MASAIALQCCSALPAEPMACISIIVQSFSQTSTLNVNYLEVIQVSLQIKESSSTIHQAETCSINSFQFGVLFFMFLTAFSS